VAAGDFNGDGVPDLATVGSFNTVSVLLGNGDGSFQAPLIFTAGRNPFSVAVGDFNGDGRLDLVTANISSNDVSVLLGNGDGSFQPARNFATGGTQPVSVVVGDFNGDGVLDLAVVNTSSNTVSVLLGNGDGTFQAPLTFAAGTNPVSVAVGDFNGDGALDLAVTNVGLDFNNEAGAVSVLLGNGDGSFQAALTFTVGKNPRSVAVGDFNRDGVPDLAVANGGSDSVSVLLGNGDGTFYETRNFATDRSPVSVVVGDFNGDGVADLAVVVSGASGSFGAVGRVSVLLGNRNGTFQAAWNFGAGGGASSVAVSDFNGDGKPDLAVGNFASRNVSVLINNTPPPHHREGQPLDLLQSSLLTGGAALDVEAGEAR